MWDRRLLQTLISNMVNQQVVDTPNYPLSAVSHKFQVPLRFEYQDFIVAIQVSNRFISRILAVNHLWNVNVICKYKR